MKDVPINSSMLKSIDHANHFPYLGWYDQHISVHKSHSINHWHRQSSQTSDHHCGLLSVWSGNEKLPHLFSNRKKTQRSLGTAKVKTYSKCANNDFNMIKYGRGGEEKRGGRTEREKREERKAETSIPPAAYTITMCTLGSGSRNYHKERQSS